MKAIIAVNNLGFIGLMNGLPWKSKEDLKHFKALTSQTEKNDNPMLLVGYNTMKTLPPLKGRMLFCAGRGGYDGEEVSKFDWCIGGKKTYERYQVFFDELHISHINDNTIGDIMFPNFTNLKSGCKIFNYYFEVDGKQFQVSSN